MITTTSHRNGQGTAGLICGLIGCLFGLLLYSMFWIAAPLGIAGLILSLEGRAQVQRGEASNEKIAKAGVWVSALALMLAAIGAWNVFGELWTAG